jgi:mono/diheme cytochrome c family protein
MFKRKALLQTMVAAALATSVFVLGGCATCHSGAKAENGSQLRSTDLRDELFTVKRAEFNGYYHNTPADEGRLWHWGI